VPHYEAGMLWRSKGLELQAFCYRCASITPRPQLHTRTLQIAVTPIHLLLAM
jgi:hypothetical protein